MFALIQIRLISMAIFNASLLTPSAFALLGLLNICSAQTGNPDFRAVSVTEFSMVHVDIQNSVLDKRYGVVDMIKSIRDGDNFRPFQRVLASVDCSNSGFEIIRDSYNVETEMKAGPRCVFAKPDVAYKEGFNPKTIQHRPVSDVIAAERQRIMDGLDEATRKIISEPSFAPEPEAVAVSYFCQVVQQNASNREAAERALATGGIPDIKALGCTFQRQNGNVIDITVRFSEASNMVQVQGEWEKERAVTGDRIDVKRRGVPLTISRITGRAQLELAGVTLQGACEAIQYGQRKF